MNVLYEGAIFEMLRCGGVARCFSELVRHLPADIHPCVIGPRKFPPPLEHPNLNYVGVDTEPPASFLRKATRKWYQRRIAEVHDATPADLEHWTYYGGLCRRPIRRADRPLVVTVLDFVHDEFPSLDPSGKHIAMKRESIAIADMLICISQSTHDQMCQRFPEAENKSTVIPLGTSLCDLTPGDLPAGLANKPYALFVGRRNNYKNFLVVWKAWKRIQACRNSELKDAKLVIVGPPMKRREADELGINDADDSVVLMPDASDSVLRVLYEHAKVFVFPSKAEGFGLPSLEAMAAGSPVIVSDLPVMREVVSDCGLYFDPDDSATLSEMIQALLTDSFPQVDSMIARARDRAATFTWDANAQATAQVYAELVGLPLNEPMMCEPVGAI